MKLLCLLFLYPSDFYIFSTPGKCEVCSEIAQQRPQDPEWRWRIAESQVPGWYSLHIQCVFIEQQWHQPHAWTDPADSLLQVGHTVEPVFRTMPLAIRYVFPFQNKWSLVTGSIIGTLNCRNLAKNKWSMKTGGLIAVVVQHKFRCIRFYMII